MISFFKGSWPEGAEGFAIIVPIIAGKCNFAIALLENGQETLEHFAE